ncbi:MAG: hypothetical protein QOK81_06150, partial [Nitrososphaeraceae archaeon]|nr:hypothetical protein [Nitrososphaeraceae archaeon]
MRYPKQGSRLSPGPGTLVTSKNPPSSIRSCAISACPFRLYESPSTAPKKSGLGSYLQGMI